MQSHLISSTRRASSTRTSPSVPSLPRLPVPNLHATLKGYLTSLEPFLLEDEARGGQDFKSAYDSRLKLAEDFEHGLGKVCQQRLLELDKSSPHNWLDDNIWLRKAYHEWRAPLIVNSNWWLALADDDAVPAGVRYTVQQQSFTSWQIRRAAWLVHRVLDFKAQLDRQEIYPDTTRTGLWFRHAALEPFLKCRIPQRGCDRFSTVPHPTDPNSRKLLVMVNDWMYTVDVLASDGSPLQPNTIEGRLRAVVHDVGARIRNAERVVPVGVLTTDDRDRWAANLEHILSLSPLNRAVYHTLTSSIFALSLDDYAYRLPPSHKSPNTDLAAHLHNIRSGNSTRPGHNRWYDKPFTLIVESNTRAGVLGEHSPVDALVPSVIADYAIVQGVDEGAFSHPLSASEDVNMGSVAVNVDAEGWERLDWVLDATIEKACADAAARAKAIVDDSDMDELVFDGYGTDWIKNEARLSPDGYVQMAMQLAWYRTRGEFTATYETALTRLFKHGRTETIRTVSADSRKWVLAMVDPQCTNTMRFELLRRALQTHTGTMRCAATGRGIDRHLLGLQLMLQPEAGESHPLFEDALFLKSQTWKLSTSGLSAGEQFQGTGFGTPYVDGYGINYMPAPDRLRFGIESKHSCPQTNTQLFMEAITCALEDMKALGTSTLESHL